LSRESSVYRTNVAEQSTSSPIAYHCDATLLADYPARLCGCAGVTHVLDDVVDRGADERGWISYVTTANRGDLAGDLFVDCTGFAACC